MSVGIITAETGVGPNDGHLCNKGRFAFEFIHHPERLKQPLVRGEDGELHPTDWDTALNRAVEGFKKALQDHGRHSVYAICSGRAPNESAYMTQKFIRTGFGSNYIDNCSRA